MSGTGLRSSALKSQFKHSKWEEEDSSFSWNECSAVESEGWQTGRGKIEESRWLTGNLTKRDKCWTVQPQTQEKDKRLELIHRTKGLSAWYRVGVQPAFGTTHAASEEHGHDRAAVMAQQSELFPSDWMYVGDHFYHPERKSATETYFFIIIDHQLLHTDNRMFSVQVPSN